MTSPAGFLDFFILEASEYLEQLDGLLHGGAPDAPDADALQRAARALRGAATMAKIPSFADVAGAMERVARGLRDGAVAWEPTVGGAMTAAVDELKTLLRTARTWSGAEDVRARARSDELARFAPARASTGTPAVGSDVMFFANEASNIAAGLELMASRPEDRDGAANVLRRVRALRGVAGIRENPPLGDVMEAAELAGKPLELGESALTDEARDVLTAGSALLRSTAAAIRGGTRVDQRSPERQRFDSAVERLHASEHERDRIVPIASLFFDDAGPHIVSEAPNPPSTPAERFRLELVSQGEHLRGLLHEIRHAPDDAARDRMRRELHRTLRALGALADSFGESRVSAAIAQYVPGVQRLDALTLNALDDLAAALTDRGDGAALEQFVTSTERGAAVDAGIGEGFAAPNVAAPSVAAPAAPPQAASAQPAREPAREPASSLSSLDAGIASLEALTSQPLAQPVAIEQPPVPIESLLYRGRAAIVRAIEIRDQLRAAGSPPDVTALGELFDLLDLALAG